MCLPSQFISARGGPQRGPAPKQGALCVVTVLRTPFSSVVKILCEAPPCFASLLSCPPSASLNSHTSIHAALRAYCAYASLARSLARDVKCGCGECIPIRRQLQPSPRENLACLLTEKYTVVASKCTKWSTRRANTADADAISYAIT